MNYLQRTWGGLGLGCTMMLLVHTSSAVVLQALRVIDSAAVVLNGGLNVMFPVTTNFGSPLLSVETTPLPTYKPDADGLIRRGVGTDLAIRGAGWFVLRVPEDDQMVYTRSGDFRIDANGYLITNQGHRVQGFNDPSLSVVGDIQIDDRYRPATSDPGATISNFNFDLEGFLNVLMSDGTQFRRGQILLQDFAAPDALERVEYHLFAGTPTALPASTLAVPGTANVGEIESSALDVTPLKPQLKSLANDNAKNPLLFGALNFTGRGLDLTIRGPGAFVVRDPVTSELFATRAGMFLLDSNNFLITYDRKRLQGRSYLHGEMTGDVQVGTFIPVTTDPEAFMAGISIARDGSINVHFSDGTEASAEQIALYDFEQPEKLRPAGLGQFAGVIAAQPSQLENVGRYGSSSSIRLGSLELVNVTSDLLARRRQLKYFTQGALYRTDNPSDLAIDGHGFFLVQDPRSGRQYATRNGHFVVDADGFLVNDRGLRLQGYPSASATGLGDLRIDADGFLPLESVGFVISRDGAIKFFLSDGTMQEMGQVLLLDFKEPFLLRESKPGLYGNLAAAQPRNLAVPGTVGLGDIQSSALESSTEPEQLFLPPRDGFRFLITGDFANRWIVQASEDGEHWWRLGVVEKGGFEVEFCDRGSHQHRARTYRVIAEYAEAQFNRPELTVSNTLTNQPARCEPARREHR